MISSMRRAVAGHTFKGGGSDVGMLGTGTASAETCGGRIPLIGIIAAFASSWRRFILSRRGIGVAI
jgi:hypothetical protein